MEPARSGSVHKWKVAVIHWLSGKSLRFPHYSIPAPDGGPMGFETIERNSDGTFWLSSGGMLLQMDVAEQGY